MNAAASMSAFSFTLLDHAYNISGTIAWPSNKSLIGQGSNISQVIMTVPGSPAFQIISGAKNLTFQDFTLTRPVASPGSVGGDGLVCLGQSEGVQLINLTMSHHYRGFVGRNTNGGLIQSSVFTQNVSHGIELIFDPNLSTPAPIQWSTEDCSLLQNSGNGLWLHSLPYTGPDAYANISVGSYRNMTSFANGGNAIRAEGRANVILHSVRVYGGFFGQDGSDLIYVDGGPNGPANSGSAHGDNHVLTPDFLELAGLGYSGPYNDIYGTLGSRSNAVGRNLALSASQAASNLSVVNSKGVNIAGSVINGATFDGLYLTNCDSVRIHDSQISNNGLSNNQVRSNGINLQQTTNFSVGDCSIFGSGITYTGVRWTDASYQISDNSLSSLSGGSYNGPRSATASSYSLGNNPANP